MSITTTHLLKPLTNASTSETRDREETLHLGTFADGQRAVTVKVAYSGEVGSFASGTRK
jgi:hypothetical protein